MSIPAPESTDYVAVLSLSAALNGQAAALEGVAGSERMDEAERTARTLRALDGAVGRHVEAERTRLAVLRDQGGLVTVECNESLATLTGLAGLWGAYHGRWDAPAICADPRRFRVETQRLLQVVGQQLALDRAEHATAD